MKRFGLFLLFILLFSLPTQAGSLGNIPLTTMEIARKAGFQNYLFRPVSKLVRVGIGTNNFSSYEWKDAVIYATGEFEIYNNQTYINTYDANNEIKIKMVGKIFVLTDSDNNVIEKVSGPIIFKTDFGLVGIKGLKRAGKDALYRGQIELISTPAGEKFYIVNQLELEDYLKGVVPNEMPTKFGIEALKAQAVAARNYVLSPRVKSNQNYDVVDSVASQVYFGANTEKELSDRAVFETSGIVALYNWELILAQYSSTAGGYTESYSNAFSDPKTKMFPSNPKPYLIATPDYPDILPLNNEEDASNFYKSKPDSFDKKSPYFRWEREWKIQELQQEIQNNISNQSATGFVTPEVKKGDLIGTIQSINVIKRAESGKIMELEIQTDKESYNVKKELVIRRLFTNKGKALPSANVIFEQNYDDDGNLISIKAYGGGYGHGVGMSQFGAGYMATELGKSFDEILKHYYSNIILATEPTVLSPTNRTAEQSFYSENGKAQLVVDNKHKTKCIEICVNGLDYSLELDTKEKINVIDISKYLNKGLNRITVKCTEQCKGIRFYIELLK